MYLQRLKVIINHSTLKMTGKALGIAAIILVIFGFGVGVGNGSVSFGSTSSQQGLASSLDFGSSQQVYRILRDTYDGKLDVEKLLDGAKGGLAQATGDPYTEYFNPEQAKAFNEQLNGSFSGIGAELGQDLSGNVQVVAPIDGSPATKAGLRAKDLVIEVDGTSTSGLTLTEVVSKIRGKKDTTVTLKLLRNKTESLTLTITRDDIKIPSVKWQILDGNIGYLQISQFSDDTTTLATQAANEFKTKRVKGVLLDLRDNPGGLLTSAVDVSSLWLSAGKTILQEKHDDKVIQTFTASGENPLLGMPTAVLINGGSASASEITAGALRDNNVATLYGEKSYGKGSVQEIRRLPKGAALKVTVARWFRPNGNNIDKKGIDPDNIVKISEDDLKNKQDAQKDAALKFLQK